MPWTSDRFLKNYSFNIKSIHLTSKSLVFVLCSESGCLHFANWINQCKFRYKMSQGVMHWTSDGFLKIPQLTLKLLI